MKTRWVFKVKKTNEYDLCHFYHMGTFWEFPILPSPHEPASCNMLKNLLEAVQVVKHINLLMTFARDSAMAICLLQELHDKDSMKCLTLQPKPDKQDVDSKPIKTLSFCPFFLYHGRNNISYMNHIVSAHYNVAYSCGKCLKVVLLSGQQLKTHIKVCMGFPKDDTN